MSEAIELEPIPASVARARRWSEAVLVELEAEELSDTMVLLVSELVSNVVLHARTPCTLQIERTGARVRVEVRDGSDRLPAAAARGDVLAPSGRGLLLVEALSAASGVESEPLGGKRVWFELAVAPPA
jgi:anti-sigma regulatory factor (Ser/Thr protein kinase)